MSIFELSFLIDHDKHHIPTLEGTTNKPVLRPHHRVRLRHHVGHSSVADGVPAEGFEWRSENFPWDSKT